MSNSTNETAEFGLPATLASSTSQAAESTPSTGSSEPLEVVVATTRTLPPCGSAGNFPASSLEGSDAEMGGTAPNETANGPSQDAPRRMEGIAEGDESQGRKVSRSRDGARSSTPAPRGRPTVNRSISRATTPVRRHFGGQAITSRQCQQNC